MYLFSFDVSSFIQTAGYAGIFGIVFAESGLLFGLFFPGDSLLLTSGLLASQGFLSLPFLIIVTFSGAVLGDSVGYWFGAKTGPKIFRKQDSLFFKKDHIRRAQEFYAQHGGKAIVLARFIAVVRTFAPIVAGVANMRYGDFLFYNIAGAFAWAVGIPLAGYFLGQAIPHIDRYFLPIVLCIIVLSILPGLIVLFRGRKR